MHLPNKPKNSKQISICQESEGNFLLGGKGVLMVESMQQRTTITSKVYQQTQKKKIHKVSHSERRLEMLTYGIALLHDNADLHIDACVQALLQHYFGWKLFGYPPHSPDLTPSDYHPFIYVKNCCDHSTSVTMSC
jgi:hypothetical protein